MSFSSFDLHPDILRGVKALGFTRPTPVQRDAIPLALEGRDLLACAMTGSGKTAAFLLPIIQRLIGKPRGKTRALVLTTMLPLNLSQQARSLRSTVIIEEELRALSLWWERGPGQCHGRDSP